MMSRNTGPAPETPDTPFIGELSMLPTQTPTVNSGVKPTVQLSRKSELVPVLQAEVKGSRRGDAIPNAGLRAALSLKISAMKKASVASNTRRGASPWGAPERTWKGRWTPDRGIEE